MPIENFNKRMGINNLLIVRDISTEIKFSNDLVNAVWLIIIIILLLLLVCMLCVFMCFSDFFKVNFSCCAHTFFFSAYEFIEPYLN